MKNIVIALALCAALAGCAENGGFGFKNHPVDCAFGYAHDDCLPGTAGYSSGVGAGISIEKNITAYKKTDQGSKSIKEAVAACVDNMKNNYGSNFDAFVRHDGKVSDIGYPDQGFRFQKCMSENGYQAISSTSKN